MNRKYIAMIPARLGSKRIPKKNIRFMGDKPLIQYPIELAKESGMFDSIWLNSEDDRLGEIVKTMGINYHKRPKELASDIATNREFTFEFLINHPCDYVIMINSTSPLLRLNTIIKFMEYVDESDFDTILSVVSVKEETIYKNEPLNFTYEKKVNSQLLEPVESICWSLTAWKRNTFIELQNRGINPVFGGKIGRFVIPKDESCDLDTLEDWRIAEGILLSRKMNIEEKYLSL